MSKEPKVEFLHSDTLPGLFEAITWMLEHKDMVFVADKVEDVADITTMDDEWLEAGMMYVIVSKKRRVVCFVKDTQRIAAPSD